MTVHVLDIKNEIFYLSLIGLKTLLLVYSTFNERTLWYTLVIHSLIRQLKYMCTLDLHVYLMFISLVKLSFNIGH